MRYTVICMHNQEIFDSVGGLSYPKAIRYMQNKAKELGVKYDPELETINVLMPSGELEYTIVDE